MSFEEAYEEAKKIHAQGHPPKYIGFQLAEMEVDDEIIDQVLEKIMSIRKADSRRQGIKEMIYGAPLIAIGMGLTIWSQDWDFDYSIAFWALPLAGLLIFIDGLARFLGLRG